MTDNIMNNFLFQKATWANQLALHQRIHLLCSKDCESIQDHIKGITEIFYEFAVIGDSIKDKDRHI